MSRSSHHYHDLAHSICGATLDNIHGLKFRHWRETAAPTRLVGVCYKQIFQPRTVGASECGKLTRKAGSPQLVETYAASSAVVEMTWIKALWESMTWRDFDILTQRRSSRPLKTMMPHVIRNENAAYYDPESTLVMDSKGLFDALDKDLPQDDRKSALEVPIIEEFMRRAMCRPRWCPHNRRSAADAMTKFKGAHSEPLFTLLRTGMYTLKGEKTELADRATLRQVGTVPRHKVSAVKSVTERVFFSSLSFICHRIEGISFRCT